MKSGSRNPPRWLICHLLACCALALALFWIIPALKSAQTPTLARPKAQDAFERYRAERAQERAETRATLKRLTADATVGAQAKALLLRRCEQTRQETGLEGALSLIGFRDPLVYVDERLVNIFLRADHLTPEESTKILALALEQTAQPARNIRIIPCAAAD